MRKRIQRPSPALVVASMALFVSLGGVGYAAATIGTSDIKNGAVTGKKIKNKTITGKDISSKTITALRGKAGATGAQGATGPQGPQGPAGAAATRLFATVNADGSLIAARSSGVVSSENTGAGTYQVFFDRALAGCTYVATPSNAGDAPETLQIGMQGQPVAGNGIFVQAANNAGTLTNVGFNLIVVCQ